MKSINLLPILSLNLFLLLLGLPALCQKDPIKLGEVETKWVAAKDYEKDLGATAVIICDYGQSYFSLGNGADMIYERHTRIKILKKEAYDKANVELIYRIGSGSREKINKIEGYTYNIENGIVVKSKLEKSQIYDTKINKYAGNIKFTMPNVKEGSVIEYSYKLTVDFDFSIRPWIFQTDIPTEWSEYRVSIPEYFRYDQIPQQFIPFSVRESKSGSGTGYSTEDFRWVMKDVPAFKEEKYISTYRDYVNRIRFQLSSINVPGRISQNIRPNWFSFTNGMLEDPDFGGYISKHGPVKDIVATTIAGKTTPKEKMNAIYDYVKTNFKYNDEDGDFPQHSVKEVLEKKTGSSQEINLLLVNMLQAANLDAFAVLLSTRSHGKVNTIYPLYGQFNYCIAYVRFDKEEHLLDASDVMRPVDMLDKEALSGEGLVLEPEGKLHWIELQKPPKTSEVVIGALEINPDGFIKGKLTTQHKGYKALYLRKKLNELTENKSVNKSEESKEEKEIKSQTFKNVKEFEKPLEAISTIETAEFTQNNGDLLYITPLLRLKITENPFQQESRKFPIDFTYPFEENYILNFSIPEGYKVEEVPKSNRFQWEDGSLKYDYFVQVSENKIQVMSKFTMNRVVYAVEEYVHLRQLYAQIIAKQEEQIVLKKK